MDHDALSDLVEAIEQREDPLLAWGVVDGGLSREELDELVREWSLGNDPLASVDEVRRELVGRGLLIEVPGSPPRWRSRMGEGLRLLSRLRQWFPGNEPHGTGWRQAPTLVSDFRYARRPRTYPRRDLPASDLDDTVEGDVERLVVRTLTSGPDGRTPLSGFQLRAFQQMRHDLTSTRSRGVIISAGTGSGKTLAFYLPALAHLAALLDQTTWTKALGVYPRNELLKDQLATAFSATRRLRQDLTESRGRGLRIGVLFGQVPFSGRSVEQSYLGWRRSGQGHVCPYLTCPGSGGWGCGGELIWRDEDRNHDRSRLTCSDCGSPVTPDEFPLTRADLRNSPPDLLFTTTEMINRGLLDRSMSEVLGMDTRRSPELVLLDEVHTYYGISGAQTAMVLRRWRERTRGRQVFVGLSATLLDAASFLSDLTGLPADRVVEVRPEETELVGEDAEYLVALRSDPASGAAVLSTTIQTGMLVGRLMDPPGTRPSEGLYGNKVFCFTDDLDVTNRLYYNLLDAEGQRPSTRGAPFPYKAPLAHLRSSTLQDVDARRAAGQSWDLVTEIGHELGPEDRLTLGRTSSQDVGVDEDAQVIVATASLEVGYDDPDVGAVIQHKSPRDVAQFLQRRGRAGRPRGMRPLTLVILSDWGRDRESYEAWDRLFDPALPPRSLATGNIHVLRMHCVQIALEWVAGRVAVDLGEVNLWRDLATPPDDSGYGRKRAEVQRRVGDELEQLLESDRLQGEIGRRVGRTLNLPPEVVDEILWHPPRALLLAAIPTLLRRLRHQWATSSPECRTPRTDLAGPGPLPDHFTGNLFSDLAVPEVTVEVPPQHRRQDEPDEYQQGVVQALREFAPGRVSRRFATRSASVRHWVPFDPSQPRIEVAQFLPIRERGTVHLPRYDADGSASRAPLVRPYRITVEQVQDDVADSSNASLIWTTEVSAHGDGRALDLRHRDPLNAWITNARAYLHADNDPVSYHRGAQASQATLRFRDGREIRVTAPFTLDGEPVLLGATFDVDALGIEVEVPTDLSKVWSGPGAPGLRAAWFLHVLQNDVVLGEYANRFTLGTLHDAYVAAVIDQAVTHSLPLEAAVGELGDVSTAIIGTVDRMFGRISAPTRSDNQDPESPSRMRHRLSVLLEETDVVERLLELSPALWSPPTADAGRWLRRRLVRTVAEAVASGGRSLCPQHDPQGLLVDVAPSVNGDEGSLTQVWLSESSVGGGGFIEAMTQAVRREPTRFVRLVRRSLRPDDGEVVADELDRLVTALPDRPELIEAFHRYRGAKNQGQQLAALERLRASMADAGIGTRHSVVAAVANRLLRPGSDTTTDKLVRESLVEWKRQEQRLGIEIDLRIWTYLWSVGTAATSRRELDALRSMLWPRGWRLRAAGLDSWNPFVEEVPTAADVVRELMSDRTRRLDVSDGIGLSEVYEALLDDGVLTLQATPENRTLLADLVAHLAVTPVESPFLQLHARVVEVVREDDGVTAVRLELPEALV